jgi:hypothetical protein
MNTSRVTPSSRPTLLASLAAKARAKRQHGARMIRAAMAAISRHCFAMALSPYSSAISARRSNIFGALRS